MPQLPAEHSDDPPWLIVLNGTSCAGKTTLAHALQECLSTRERPVLHIEADRFLPHLPAVWPRDDLTVASSMSRALHRAVAAFVETGFDVIVDGVLPYGRPLDRADACMVFSRYRVCYVGVHCAVAVLDHRERARPDRERGWARQQSADLHTGMVYDLAVDTTSISAAVNAARICAYLRARAGVVDSP